MDYLFYDDPNSAYGEIFIHGKEINFKYKKGMPIIYRFDTDLKYEEANKNMEMIKKYLDDLTNINKLDTNLKIEENVEVIEAKKNVLFKVKNLKPIFEMEFNKNGTSINFFVEEDSKIKKLMSKGNGVQKILEQEIFEYLFNNLYKLSKNKMKIMINSGYKNKK